MDTEQWLEANSVLDELISLSESQDEVYFLDDARFRKIFCLKALGRHNEVPAVKAEISPNAGAFIGARHYRLDDV